MLNLLSYHHNITGSKLRVKEHGDSDSDCVCVNNVQSCQGKHGYPEEYKI